ncbi:MAG: class I SAM-dependent methyltransferase [Gemmataceae bacterium]|nr:class I SAM-dependent methyltransferase [Gemmataceae bacterium]
MAVNSASPRDRSASERPQPWRDALAVQLHGSGVEFGPGIHPLRLGPFVDSIRYCDVECGESYAMLFPELSGRDTVHFPPKIDYRVDFNREPFVEMIGAGTLDFVIANHVLEHLINPLDFLEQCYQLLKPQGLLYLGLPDKRRIFDHLRQRTPLEDVLGRYERKEADVSDSRILEALRKHQIKHELPDSSHPDHTRVIGLHRKRTVHLNVWIIDDLVEMFQHLGQNMGMPLALLDGTIAGEEFILLLRKTSRREVLDSYPMIVQRIHLESAGLSPGLGLRLNELGGFLMRLREQFKKVAFWRRLLGRRP